MLSDQLYICSITLLHYNRKQYSLLGHLSSLVTVLH